jgi:hypothetical protein
VLWDSPSELEMWSRFPVSRKLSYHWTTVDGCPSALIVFTVVKAKCADFKNKRRQKGASIGERLTVV